jgi:hypothetical protein
MPRETMSPIYPVGILPLAAEQPPLARLDPHHLPRGDQHRYDIEAPKLDSTAVRLSWNPTANWSLQASWADEKSLEQLEPEVAQRKLSASAIYTVPAGDHG